MQNIFSRRIILEKKQTKKSSILWLSMVAIIAVSLLLFCQFYFGDKINSKSTYLENTHVNGVDVSGLTKHEAENLLTEKILEKKDSINITLKNKNEEWEITGDELQVVANLEPTLTQVMAYGREGNIFSKRKMANKVKDEGLYVDIPYQDIYGGLEDKIESITRAIENRKAIQTINFDPDGKTMFSLNEESQTNIVDQEALQAKINEALNGKTNIIEIPLQPVLPKHDLQDFVDTISLRSKFSTDFANQISRLHYQNSME